MLILNFFFTVVSLLLAIPVLWFCIQISCACRPRQFHPKESGELPDHVAVLIPAHNESVNLIPTLQSIHSQGIAGLRILVVADNCNDDTADIARREGAEVVARHNQNLCGKGYALDFGVRHLSNNPPAVVIILDADCVLEGNVLGCLSKTAIRTGRPVQALYIMRNVGKVSIKSKIAEFAWLVKNHVRPRGLHRMGLPCQLTGSGMAFPWPVIQVAPLATGDIVEDMKIGIALAALGHPPLFSENTVVSSRFPSHKEDTRSQRTRWEHGHLSIMLKECLPNLINGLCRRDKALFFLALDLSIPPLALLVVLMLIFQLISLAHLAATGNLVPFATGLTLLLITAASVYVAWHKFGRSILTGQQLLLIPVYIASKLSVYAAYLFRRQAEWVRSKRDNETR